MSNIIKLENINEELARGLYGDIECIIMKSNDYINVSKLCKYGLTKGDNPKEFYTWLENNSSQELIKYIEQEYLVARNSWSSALIKRMDLANDYKGYYAHKYIVVQVAQWISPQFALRISRMYDDYATKKYQYEINKKESRVVEVELMLQEQRETNRILKEDRNRISEDLRILRIRSDEQLNVNEELLYQSDKTNNKLNDIKDSFKKININEINNTSLVDSKHKEILMLISVSFSNEDLVYIINRCQTCSYRSTRNNSIKNYELEKNTIMQDITPLYYSSSNNAVAEWMSIRSNSRNKFRTLGSRIEFINNYTYDNLIDDLNLKSQEIRKPIEELNKLYKNL